MTDPAKAVIHHQGMVEAGDGDVEEEVVVGEEEEVIEEEQVLEDGEEEDLMDGEAKAIMAVVVIEEEVPGVGL